jgi:hypothetical protein
MFYPVETSFPELISYDSFMRRGKPLRIFLKLELQSNRLDHNLTFSGANTPLTL